MANRRVYPSVDLMEISIINKPRVARMGRGSQWHGNIHFVFILFSAGGVRCFFLFFFGAGDGLREGLWTLCRAATEDPVVFAAHPARVTCLTISGDPPWSSAADLDQLANHFKWARQCFPLHLSGKNGGYMGQRLFLVPRNFIIPLRGLLTPGAATLFRLELFI